ncbi:MAG TPA: YihY/virulence factor BrkB family protein [Gemmatimonadaceae bacterium]
MVIKGYRVGSLLRKTVVEFVADDAFNLAASAAFSFFFSLFPLLLFLAPLLGVIGDKRHLVDSIVERLSAVVPDQQLEVLRSVLFDVLFSPSAPGLMSLGLILAAWSGSQVFGTLMTALNAAYDVKDHRRWITQQLIRLGSFALASLIVGVSTIVFINGEGVTNLIGRALGMREMSILIWKVVQFPIAFAGLVALAYMTFYLLPDVRQKKGHLLIAAVVTTLLWVIATLLFRLYLRNFPPNPAYGFIGAVIIMLTWMYVTMIVVITGGELAAELHHGTGAIHPDKGAIYIGRIVTEGGPGKTSTERTS